MRVQVNSNPLLTWEEEEEEEEEWDEGEKEEEWDEGEREECDELKEKVERGWCAREEKKE